ncbi:MAG: hypothetical protein V3W18_13435 [candidate division Zixibacteria bacterium]
MGEWIPQLIRAVELLGVALISAGTGILVAILQHRSSLKRMKFEQRFKVAEHKYNTYEKRIFTLSEQMSNFFASIGTAIAEVVNPVNIGASIINVEKTKAFLMTFITMLKEGPDMIEADFKREGILDQESKEEIEYIRRIVNKDIDDISESNAGERLIEIQIAVSKLHQLYNQYSERKRDQIFDKLLE